MILVVDHYDSFTYNLVQLIESLGRSTTVVKSDERPADELVAMKPDAVVLSPGPGHPATPGASPSCSTLLPDDDAGARRVSGAPGDRPGGGRHRRPRHADARQGLARVPRRRAASSRASASRSRRAVTTRSWSSATTCPTELELTAWTEDGLVMGDPAPRAPAVRRAVPPREHPHARGTRGSSRTSSRLTLTLRRAGSRGRTRTRRVGRDPARALVDGHERPRGDLLELVDEARSSTRVDRALEVPVAPVVGHDQPVALHRADHDPRVGAERRFRRSSPCSRNRAPIGGQRGRFGPGRSAAPARGTRRAVHVDRHPDRVVDDPRRDLVVAEQAREDRQTGGVRARPARPGAASFDAEVEHRARCPLSGRRRSSAPRTARTGCSARDRS